ncbi:hypothetical protein M9Y10_032843 [Tritrichomonas musculus]|uniref:USP domain-containing protein n=1 Tax=Tritrichomonas musculus TaxID=1915356 RepID=A0ABR2GXZ3_9EUKA
MDEFVFSADSSPTLATGISIQTIRTGSDSLVLAFDHKTSSLSIFLSRSNSLNKNESKHFMVEIRTEKIAFNTSVQFTNTRPFCHFTGITVPFAFTAQSTEDYRNPLIPYVGISNLGTTCYIASSLQFLTLVAPFASLIFQQKQPPEGICKELQSVFRDILSAFSTVQIRNFISSFGTNSYYMAVQDQDAHEFILTLFDKLDKELGKDFEKARNEIFGVHSVIIFQSADVKTEVDEFSNEIDLPIKKFKNINESLDYLIEEEPVNQWDTGTDHGKQDAVRQLRYKNLPPFLIFNLKRYDFDEEKQNYRELRSRFECPETLDMKKYCVDDIDCETTYRMVAVIAHRGNPQSGHYIAFTQPKFNDGRWFQFNDSYVHPSSFNNVTKLFGGIDNTFTRMWSFISGGSFIAYLIGYIRIDCIDQFKNGPNVPISISPFLSNQYTCKVIFSDQIDGSKIYGCGKQYIWEEKSVTFKQIFSNIRSKNNENDEKANEDTNDDEKEIEEFDAFVSLPFSDRLFGPIPLNTEAFSYTVKGLDSNFIAIKRNNKKTIKEPVFFISDSDYVGVFDKEEIFAKFSKEYEFRHEGIPLTDISNSTIHSGSIIFGVPLEYITLNVNKKEYKHIKPKTTYKELQLMFTNNDESRASRLLFYSLNKDGDSDEIKRSPLRPRKYPTALELHMMGNLEASLLKPPITVSSLDLYSPFSIDLYDIGHSKSTKSNLWFSKVGTVSELVENLPDWFNYKEPQDKYHYIVSLRQDNGISQVFNMDQRPASINLRIDMAKAPLLMTMKEIRSNIIDEECQFLSVEVRTMTYKEGWPHFKANGIFVLNKSSTCNSIQKSLFIGAAASLKPVKYLIRGTVDFYKGYQIEGKDNLFNILERISEEREWSNERPVIIFQMNERNLNDIPQF